MRISTVMAAYNAERYVAQALDSVLAQTLPVSEIIVVDDGSTDRTSEVLRAYASRIRVIRQDNRGPACAFNVGIAAASGDALAFLDADDLWVPDKLRIQSEALAAEPELEAVFGYVQQFASPDLAAETAQAYAVPSAPQPGVSKNAILIRRPAFERIGAFDENYSVIDFPEWYARARALGLRSRMLSEVVTLRRQHPDNLGRRKRSEQHAALLEMLKRSIASRRAHAGVKRKS
jgi:glycosyltransferase involved in cell wall biosynthesis